MIKLLILISIYLCTLSCTVLKKEQLKRSLANDSGKHPIELALFEPENLSCVIIDQYGDYVDLKKHYLKNKNDNTINFLNVSGIALLNGEVEVGRWQPNNNLDFRNKVKENLVKLNKGTYSTINDKQIDNRIASRVIKDIAFCFNSVSYVKAKKIDLVVQHNNGEFKNGTYHSFFLTEDNKQSNSILNYPSVSASYFYISLDIRTLGSENSIGMSLEVLDVDGDIVLAKGVESSSYNYNTTSLVSLRKKINEIEYANLKNKDLIVDMGLKTDYYPLNKYYSIFFTTPDLQKQVSKTSEPLTTKGDKVTCDVRKDFPTGGSIIEVNLDGKKIYSYRTGFGLTPEAWLNVCTCQISRDQPKLRSFITRSSYKPVITIDFESLPGLFAHFDFTVGVDGALRKAPMEQLHV